VLGGLALLAGAAVVVVGHRRGRGTVESGAFGSGTVESGAFGSGTVESGAFGSGTVESGARDHGMPRPAGHRKAARLLRYAERFGLPVVSFVDTPGAYPGERAEQENPGHAIAANLALLAGLRVPVVCVVLGEASSPAALAFGVGDRLLMLANSTYSVASPEAAASALFQDARQAPELARALRLTAADLYGHGIADEVLAEPPGGAHTDHGATAAAIRDALVRHLGPLRALPVQSLLDQRQRRLREAA
jgi:acyl-CoA carboxylase subunit beta